MKKIALLLVVVVAVMMFASCTSPTGKSGGDKKYAIVTNDAIGDRGFVDMAYEGIKKANEEFGIEFKVFECHGDSSMYLDNLRTAASGYDVIFIVPGYFFDKELEEVKDKYPNKTYIYVDGVTSMENVKSAVFMQNEGAFLAGALAALLTQDTSVDKINAEKKVGFVGGADMPVIRDYQAGFEHGVRYTDSTVEVISRYAGDHYDPAKGKDTAYMTFQSGADVIFQAAGPTGLGILEAAKEYNFYAIGVDTDQGYLHPNYIVSSMLKRVDTAVYTIVKSIHKGEAIQDVYTFNVANGGIGLARNEYYDKIVPQAIKDKVDEIEQKLVKGEIEVDTYK